MKWTLSLLFLLVLAAPAAALTMDVAGSSPGSAVTVTLDTEANVTFQMNSGTPYYAHGTTVKFVPHLTGTLTVTAEAKGQSVEKNVKITSGGTNDGGGDLDDDSGPWKTVTLGPGTFNVTTENGEVYSVKQRTALGALDASGADYVLDDKWYEEYGTLYLKSVNGREGEGLAGWVYQVNEKSPSVGANSYSVKKGDKVIFYYSESMSAEPEDSTGAIYLKVAFGTTTSNGGDGGEGSETIQERLAPAEDPAISLNLPQGVTLTFGAGGARISVRQDAGGDGEEVIVRGDRVILIRPGLLLTVLTGDMKAADNSSTARIKSVTAELMPAAAGLNGTAGTAGKIILSLAGIPAEGVITTDFSDLMSPDMTESLTDLAATEGRSLLGIAYVMDVNKTNLRNGEDILGATVRMEVDPAWVKEHGGAGAVRIAHLTDDGTVELLETRMVQESEKVLTFEAESQNGLSSFVPLALGDKKETPPDLVTPLPPEAEGGTTPPTTPSQQTPLWALTPFSALLIVGATHLIKRNEEKK
ncbi:hypothetical protein J2129_001966 [Methanofollis sp. W23]|uniref:DUF4430 domain-containing protein n=1 Tax=Methanofollis sp. W23 TaxID=2817849 RepID=UPI001AE56B1F|nr:DUF4430 domain-containing protein [Methanofollis sp. W23]MBP2146512.1 hypothetical protein [Methanofollis sp. W23]